MSACLPKMTCSPLTWSFIAPPDIECRSCAQQYYTYLKQFSVNDVVSVAIFIVPNVYFYTICPLSPAEGSVQLSMSKYWFWQMDTYSVIFLSLALVYGYTKTQSKWKLPSDNGKWKVMGSVIIGDSGQELGSPPELNHRK